MTATRVKNWPRAMAKRMGLGGEVEFTQAAVGQTLHLFCSAGNHIVDEHIAARQHPDAVVKKLLGKGWVMGSKLRCPDHSRRPKVAHTTKKAALLSDAAPRSARLSRIADQILDGTVAVEVRETTDDAPLTRNQRRVINRITDQETPKETPVRPVREKKPMTEVTATPSDAAKRAQRMVYLLLEEQYDESKKRYRAGWNDNKVSIESGAHINVVTKIREDFFGPVGEPEELSELRAAIELEKGVLRERRADDDKRILGLENKLHRLCEKNGWSVL